LEDTINLLTRLEVNKTNQVYINIFRLFMYLIRKKRICSNITQMERLLLLDESTSVIYL
jgi:hypothetical protein